MQIQVSTTSHILSKHTGSVNAAVFSPSGKSILTGSSDGKLAIWNSSGDFIATSDFGLGVYSVAFSPDGARFLVGTGTLLLVLPPRPSVYVFDATKGGPPILTFGAEGMDAFYTSLAYSPREAKILTGMASDMTSGTGELVLSSNQLTAVRTLIGTLNEVGGVELKSATADS